jgi:diaminohydroxyphosphoribosylaminopyrimidine deaminase/5-amino-6-(5-phosphoribosylamino)uracil reductase
MPAIATEQDRAHMSRALALAERGRGSVSPNPMVGAVLVREGELIGEGFHARYGGAHAEVAALEDCRGRGLNPAGATMYVTLEPCAHQGRTPPCTDAILDANVARVVIGSDDPSEKASGRGPGILRDGGVDVEFANGTEATAARLLNQAFRKHARSGRPLVTFKAAISLDGRVASADGDSKWISGESSRRLVHRWRAETDAICVGIGTALADDPLLTARDLDPPPDRRPTRLVFDSGARLPLSSKLVQTAADVPLLLAVSSLAPPERAAMLRDAGAEILVIDGDPADRVRAALAELGRRGITSLMLEGGPTLAASFLAAGEIDELCLFIAPLLLGADARPLIAAEGAASIADATRALAVEWEQSGEDQLVRARLREW